MKCKTILALGGALALAAVAPAAAVATTVTVRVEGKNRTLLATTPVHTHTGWITKGGVTAGKCSAASAMGALNTATRGHWDGSFSTDFNDYFVKAILGETDNGPHLYWSIFVNDRSAQTGACGIKLHAGDQLLFAAATYPEYPVAIEAPAADRVGKPLNVTVVWFDAKGKRKPLAGATVSLAGTTAKTNGKGVVALTPSRAGTFQIHADKSGYVRAAAARLKVAS